MSTSEPRPMGVGLMPLETRLEAILHTAERADELGYTAFFLPETWSFDVTVLMATLATRTKRIKLGAGVLNPWGRSAATLAMAAATLNMVSGGRFILGIGASTPELARGWHDRAYEAPLNRLRQSITQVRALLSGERLPLFEETGARPLRLNLPPQPDLPIYLAATSPRSIRLAGELADGWLSFYTHRDKMAGDIALIEEGRAASDTGRSVQVCSTASLVVAKERAVARQGAAWVVSMYLTRMGSFYRNTLIRQGYEPEVTAVLKANQDKKPGVVPPEAETLLDGLTIYGTPDEIQPQIEAWYAAGVDQPGIMLNPGLSKEEIDLALESCRPA